VTLDEPRPSDMAVDWLDRDSRSLIDYAYAIRDHSDVAELDDDTANELADALLRDADFWQALVDLLTNAAARLRRPAKS